MSVTASARASNRLFLGWLIFAGLNVAAMFVLPGEETIPFHFVWISLSLVYGLLPWSSRRTAAVLAAVCVLTGVALLLHVRNGVIGWEETTEVPLMAFVFLAMVWHVKRRMAAEFEARLAAESERRTRDAQRRFVRFASHELRTPVTVARGFTELLRQESLVDQAKDDAGIVLDELDKLERISARLLTLAQIDEHSSPQPEPIDLDLILVQTVKRWRPVADRRWLCESHAGSLVADPERLITALDCLLDNAVRHTSADGCIGVTARRVGADVVIEVYDDGEGITPDDLPFVFDSFRSGARGGTGMGLAIVKAVFESHGGSVAVTSRPGLRTTFTLRLPAVSPGLPDGTRIVEKARNAHR